MVNELEREQGEVPGKDWKEEGEGEKWCNKNLKEWKITDIKIEFSKKSLVFDNKNPQYSVLFHLLVQIFSSCTFLFNMLNYFIFT